MSFGIWGSTYSLAARCRVAATSEALGGAIAKIDDALGSSEAKLCHLAWPASCPWYATTAIAHLVKARAGEPMIAKVDRAEFVVAATAPRKVFLFRGGSLP